MSTYQSFSITLHLACVIWPIEFEIFVSVRNQPNTLISFFLISLFALHAVAQLVDFAGSIPDGVFMAALWSWG